MPEQFQVVEVNFSFQVGFSAAFVWDCLVHKIGKWWTREFFSSERTKYMRLESFVGGRMYEDFGDQEGLLWAHVIHLDEPGTLTLKGHLSPEWGGPAINFITIRLEGKPEGTVFHFSDATMGKVSENSRVSLEKGWRAIFEQAFKEFLEGQKETT